MLQAWTRTFTDVKQVTWAVRSHCRGRPWARTGASDSSQLVDVRWVHGAEVLEATQPMGCLSHVCGAPGRAGLVQELLQPGRLECLYCSSFNCGLEGLPCHCCELAGRSSNGSVPVLHVLSISMDHFTRSKQRDFIRLKFSRTSVAVPAMCCHNLPGDVIQNRLAQQLSMRPVAVQLHGSSIKLCEIEIPGGISWDHRTSIAGRSRPLRQSLSMAPQALCRLAPLSR